MDRGLHLQRKPVELLQNIGQLTLLYYRTSDDILCLFLPSKETGQVVKSFERCCVDADDQLVHSNFPNSLVGRVPTSEALPNSIATLHGRV